MKQNNNVNQHSDAVQRGHFLSGDAPLPFPVFKLAPFCPLSQLKCWTGTEDNHFWHSNKTMGKVSWRHCKTKFSFKWVQCNLWYANIHYFYLNIHAWNKKCPLVLPCRAEFTSHHCWILFFFNNRSQVLFLGEPFVFAQTTALFYVNETSQKFSNVRM